MAEQQFILSTAIQALAEPTVAVDPDLVKIVQGAPAQRVLVMLPDAGVFPATPEGRAKALAKAHQFDSARVGAALIAAGDSSRRKAHNKDKVHAQIDATELAAAEKFHIPPGLMAAESKVDHAETDWAYRLLEQVQGLREQLRAQLDKLQSKP